MTESLIQFEGGDILANVEERTITGLLIPYNEVGRTNVGRFQVEAGSVQLPADPAIVGVNLDHERSSTVGRAVRLWEAPEGVMATLAIARTPEGDAALADATSPDGKRRKLSGEFGPAMIRAGRLVAGHAKLWGAALVEAGAFPSAQVLASDTPDAPAAEPDAATAEPTETVEKFSEETQDENGNTVKRTTTRTTRTEPDGQGGTKTTITEKTVTEEPDAPAPANPEEEPAVAVPNTLATAQSAAPIHDLGSIFASIATLKANPHDESARQVLAALSDLKMTGTGALPGAGVIQPNWVGELTKGLAYVRQFIGLQKLGTNITAGGKKGYKLFRGTAASPIEHFDGDWAGNKTAINSGVGFTSTHSSTLDRYAIGDDIGREFYDLPGGVEVVEAFLRFLVEDHAYWSDQKAINTILATAGAPIAPKTYPAKYADSPALGMLIQGILAAKRKKADGRRDVPTYAIANTEAYEQLVYTPKDLIPEFITFSATTDGTATADGIHVIEGPTGIEDSASVIVGADYAIEFDELSNGPLHVDALDIARGGIDKAVHGYLQTFVVRPEAIVKVGVADS